jgi:acid phosphatase (class A)
MIAAEAFAAKHLKNGGGFRPAPVFNHINKICTMRHLLFSMHLLGAISAFAQNIHPLEPVSGHYQSLQKENPKAQPNRAWMDTLSFPPDKYSWSALYALIQPYYLTPQQVTALKKGPQAPANSSPQTRAELDYLLDLQAKRTPEQVKRVTYLGEIGYWPHINVAEKHPGYAKNQEDLFFEGREIFGATCTPMAYPQTLRLFKGMMNDMRIMEFALKYEQLRARPYHLESSLQPLAIMQSPSFASGHTLWAYLQAFLWSELRPDKRSQFLALSEEIRQSREIMGIHFPSDNETARVLAHQMLSLMAKNQKFHQDLKTAKLEWK